MRAFPAIAALAALLMLTACERTEGPAENAAEQADQPAGTTGNTLDRTRDQSDERMQLPAVPDQPPTQ